MIRVIRSEERGNADHGWLRSKHTFSFANYHNPSMMGFARLRVINEDWIEPGQGFGTHPHRDMEILTYMIDGALEHKDSMGNGSVIRPGELQRMTAGTGILHSEFNHSHEDTAHLLQIWILPERNGLEPGYEQKLFPAEEKRNRWLLVASRGGREGSLKIHQDVNLCSAELESRTDLDYHFDGHRRGLLQLVRGSVEIAGVVLVAGDALVIEDQPSLTVCAVEDSELLLFDME